MMPKNPEKFWRYTRGTTKLRTNLVDMARELEVVPSVVLLYEKVSPTDGTAVYKYDMAMRPEYR